MGLGKFLQCDQTHQKQFEYCCLKESKVFCKKCWEDKRHFDLCASTRCGHYQKLAHLTINRALQFKNNKLLQQSCQTAAIYDKSRKQFANIISQILECLKDFIDQKCSLLLWTMTNQMIQSHTQVKQVTSTIKKFEGICSEMIKIIKSGGKNNKSDHLQATLNSYYQVSNEVKGDSIYFREHCADRTEQLCEGEKQILKAIEYCKSEAANFCSTLKDSFRPIIDNTIKGMVSGYNPCAKYNGVQFPNQPIWQSSFHRRQQYPLMNMFCQNFTEISSNQGSELYNGFNIKISQLQKCPDQILQLSKAIFKDKLYSFHDSITTIKSAFSYKYFYPIATTLSQDQQYESLIIELEKQILQSFSDQKTNPFLLTLHLIIIGREVILIQIKNQNSNLPLSYQLKIYGYQDKRKHFYLKILELLGMVNYNQSSQKQIIYQKSLNDQQLLYCNFKIAHDCIFSPQKMHFEGEVISAQKGKKLFGEIIEKMKKWGKIDLNFDKKQSQLLALVI